MKKILGKTVELIGKETATCLGVAEYLSGEKKVLLLRQNAQEPYRDSIKAIKEIKEKE